MECSYRKSRLNKLRQLKRAKVDPAQLVCFYITCIRPVREYACKVFHDGPPLYHSEEPEKIQRRALRIIFPELGYHCHALSKTQTANGAPF